MFKSSSFSLYTEPDIKSVERALSEVTQYFSHEADGNSVTKPSVTPLGVRSTSRPAADWSVNADPPQLLPNHSRSALSHSHRLQQRGFASSSAQSPRQPAYPVQQPPASYNPASQPQTAGDETPPFSPGSPVEDGVGHQVLSWAHQFKQCVDLMHGPKHAGLLKQCKVLLGVLDCTKLVTNPKLLAEIDRARADCEIATNLNRKMHLERKLRILRGKQGASQYRAVLRTIKFLTSYVEKKFPVSDNVTVKTLHVLAELKQNFRDMQPSDQQTIVAEVIEARPTFSASAYTASHRDTRNDGALAAPK